MASERFSRVTVGDLGDSPFRVLTIATARVQSFSKDYLSDEDRKVVLTFRETGDKEFVCNRTSYNLLVDRYGDPRPASFTNWIGKQCVLARNETTNPQQPGSRVLSVWVARPGEWDSFVRQTNSAERGARTERAAGRRARK